MNPTLRKIVEHELGKIAQMSTNDLAVLSPANLEALEALARILKQDPSEDDLFVQAVRPEDLQAALKAVEP